VKKPAKEFYFLCPMAQVFNVMLVASWGIFDEKISVVRLVGTLVVCIGVLIIARS
jgi:drug/metabolite transporter (DMT)-like permease